MFPIHQYVPLAIILGVVHQHRAVGLRGNDKGAAPGTGKPLVPGRGPRLNGIALALVVRLLGAQALHLALGHRLVKGDGEAAVCLLCHLQQLGRVGEIARRREDGKGGQEYHQHKSTRQQGRLYPLEQQFPLESPQRGLWVLFLGGRGYVRGLAQALDLRLARLAAFQMLPHKLRRLWADHILHIQGKQVSDNAAFLFHVSFSSNRCLTMALAR